MPIGSISSTVNGSAVRRPLSDFNDKIMIALCQQSGDREAPMDVTFDQVAVKFSSNVTSQPPLDVLTMSIGIIVVT